MIDDVYQLALAALRHHLNEARAPYEVDDGEIFMAGHRLGLSITFEDFVTQGSQVIAPLDIQIHLDGDSGDRFRVGTLGVGDDRTSAVQAAVAEWHLLAAAPLLSALGAPVEKRRAAAKTPQLAGWKLFPGRVGIRGRKPAELDAGGQFYRLLLETLRDVVGAWTQPARFELHSIYLLATCGQTREMQAAVDGFVNEKLIESLSALPWPAGDEVYLYKQLFVLRGGD